MKNFALTGIAGYIAPRHLQAIKDTGNNLIAVCDPHDAVGIIDRYFPEADYFREFERFDRHLEKFRRNGGHLDYLSICTPNHLHDAHIRLALRLGADAICEKPLVLNPWNLDALSLLENEFGKKVYTILQLRVHQDLIKLKEKLNEEKSGKKYKVDLTYITSRGSWYDFSWKGDLQKSGGIATNIGVHFFDLLIWLFGNVRNSEVHLKENRRMSGFIELENAEVLWYLSLNREDLPEEAVRNNKTTFRSIMYDDKEIQFSEGFTELHTRVYEEILVGRGFGIEEARPAIELVHKLRNDKVCENPNEVHYLLKK